MNRFAVLSDIHSNIQALEAVWERVEAIGVDGVFCLGDIVGYGARPVECLSLIRDNNVVCVQGNHDALIANPRLNLAFNIYSLAAVAHNRQLLDEASLSWLGKLPTSVRHSAEILFVHGAPDDRDRYLVYLDDLQAASEEICRTDGPGLCFFGHTHLPMVFDGVRFDRVRQTSYRIPQGVRTLLNPGSVGQPRDKDPRASFAWWDQASASVHFERVAYDVEGARQNILDAGLPAILGDRLRDGR